jgi:Fe-S cluster assembly ATP-binding protein
MKELLKIKELHNSIGEKRILKGINLDINEGEIHVIMGPNGSGKSTLASTLIGDTTYSVESGEIIYQGENINHDSVDKRAKKGIFLAFQQPEEIDGITLKNFIRTAKGQIEEKPIKVFEFNKKLDETLKKLDFDAMYSNRYLNIGFSGGEKKKSEIVQMLMLNPKLAILDEIDSGLDVDAVKSVSNAIKHYHNSQNAILIITHNSKMLEILEPDYVHILMDGRIIKSGDETLIKEVEKNGFDMFRKQV